MISFVSTLACRCAWDNRALFRRIVVLCLGFACLTGRSVEPGVGASASHAYHLSPRDLLEIRVFDEPDLTVMQRIDDQGMLKLPLLQNLDTSGLTLSSLEAAIEAAYRDQRLLRDPDVTVFIRDYAVREVSVLGQVRRVGTLPFPPERNTLSIVEVVSLAGGFTDIAKSNKVQVTRRGPDGVESVFEVDVSALISGDAQRPSGGFTILPGDILYVPERVF